MATVVVTGARAEGRRLGLGGRGVPLAGLALPLLVAAVLELGAATGWLQSRFLPPPSRIFTTLDALWASGDLQGLRSIPSIAWVPLFILWFGIFETPKVALIALGAFFPVYLSLSTALGEVDRKLVEVGLVNGFDRWAIVRRIMLPAALPGWVVGLRGGLALGWMFVIAAELMGASAGIGYLLLDGQMTGNAAQIVGCLILFALFGKLTDMLLVLVSRPWLAWQDSVAERERSA
jgi:sulfonate transport system permease protein